MAGKYLWTSKLKLKMFQTLKVNELVDPDSDLEIHKYSRVYRRTGIMIGLGILLFLIVTATFGILVYTRAPIDGEEPHLQLQDGAEASFLKSLQQHLPISPPENTLENSVCEGLPEEISTMTRGIDITKLDLFPTSVESLRNRPGFARQVVRLTCRLNYAKMDLNGVELIKLPDQVRPTSYEIKSGLVSSEESSNHTERSSEDIKVQMAMDVGVSAFKLGMFSASASYKSKRESMLSKRSSYSETKMAYLARHVDFSTSSTVSVGPHEDLQHIVTSKLPDTFHQDPSAYLSAVGLFGTHYFVSASFGGYIQNMTEYIENTQRSGNSQEAKVQIQAEYKELKGGIGGGKTSDNSSDSFFVKESTKRFVFGGNVTLAYAGRVRDWVDSVSRSPKLFSGKLVPVSTLIEDQAKAKAYEFATQVYLGNAYVADLRESLEIVMRKSEGCASDSPHTRRMKEMIFDLRHQTYEVLASSEKLEVLTEKVLDLMRSPASKDLIGIATITVLEASVPSATFLGLRRDAYVKTTVQSADTRRSFTTGTIKNSNNPVWNQEYNVMVDRDGTVQFCVFDRGVGFRKHYTNEMGCSNVLSIRELLCKGKNGLRLDNTGFENKSLSVKISWHQYNTTAIPVTTETSSILSSA